MMWWDTSPLTSARCSPLAVKRVVGGGGSIILPTFSIFHWLSNGIANEASLIKGWIGLCKHLLFIYFPFINNLIIIGPFVRPTHERLWLFNTTCCIQQETYTILLFLGNNVSIILPKHLFAIISVSISMLKPKIYFNLYWQFQL